MGESGTGTAETAQLRAGAAEPAPRPAGTRLLLSRLPVTILVAAYVIVFAVRQLPELAGVRALAQIARQASVLVWAPLPGTGGAGAAGGDGVFMLLAVIGAVALALLGTTPSVTGRAVPGIVRGRFGWLALPAAALVVFGLVVRVITVLDQSSWSPVPAGGVAFGLLAAATAVFSVREIVLAGPGTAGAPGAVSSPAVSSRAVSSRAVSSGSQDGGAWRGKGWFLLIALTWFGDVAIGRYFEPKLLPVIAAVAPARRWHYLFSGSSWWLYLLGLLVVFTGYALLQLLPPWGGRARQIVIAAICVIAAFVAVQQVHPYAHTAVTHVIQHPPKP